MLKSSFNPSKSNNLQEECLSHRAPSYGDKKSVVISGGTNGIGLEIVRELAAEGHAVTTVGRNYERVRKLQLELPDVDVSSLDVLTVSHPEDGLPTAETLPNFFSHGKFNQLVERVKSREGCIDAVIQNAGITGIDPEHQIDTGSWINSTLAQLFAVAPELAKSQGLFVFVTSPLVHQAANLRRHHGQVPSEIEPYIASKNATETWLRRCSLWTEREFGWNKICFFDPGSVDTRMHKEVLDFASPELRARTSALLESGRLRDPVVVGKILSRIATSGMFYDDQTQDFSAEIPSCARLEMTDEMYLSLARVL